jgi:O-succinylbenzoic acid--CoA ligase
MRAGAAPLFLARADEARYRQGWAEARARIAGAGEEARRGLLVLPRDGDPADVGWLVAGLEDPTVPLLLGSATWGAETWRALARSLRPALTRGPVPEGLPWAAEPVRLPGETVLVRTGGSSGVPRFARQTLPALQAAARHLAAALGGGPLSAALLLPLWHVGGLLPVVRARETGGQLCRPGDPGSAGALPGHRLLSVVPTHLQRALAGESPVDLVASATLLFAGGAAFPAASLAEARARGWPLAPVYGQTETAGMVALQRPDSFRQEGVPRLEPLPGNRITLGEGGEIRVVSDQLFSGYLGGPVRSGDAWGTGDRGQWDERGRLAILGRLGRFLQSGGETVSLEHVEHTATTLSGVVEAVAVARPDPAWGERVWLAVAVGEGGTTAAEVAGQLRSRLDPAERPARIAVHPELPRTAAGKVDSDRLFP